MGAKAKASGSVQVVRGVILGQEKPVDVSVDLHDHTITQIRRAGRGPVDFGGEDCLICPPLVDTQVNGANGVDLQADDLCVEDVWEVARCLAACGVSRWFPTLITAPLDAMEHRCRVIADAADEMPPGLGAAIAGIHLEGPFISPEDGARGAHPAEHVRPPSNREMARLLKAGRGRVRCVTLAPGLPKIVSLIHYLDDRDIVVSLGHHNATARQITTAVDEGASLCTHLGNGLPEMIHRHHNPIWPQLADPDLAVSLVGDFYHLPFDMLEAMVLAKGWDKCMLVSDSTHLTGMPPGRYSLMGQPVTLERGGKVVLDGTGLLAGSAVNLFDGVRRVSLFSRIPPVVVHTMASLTPAAFFGIDYPGWPVETGKQAHFIVQRAEGAGPDDQILALFMDGACLVPEGRRKKGARYFSRGSRKSILERHSPGGGAPSIGEPAH